MENNLIFEVERLKKEVWDLAKNTVANLEDSLESTTSDLTDLESTVSGISSSLTNTNNTVDTLSTNVGNLSTTVNTATSDIQNTKSGLTALSNTVTNIIDDVTDLNSEVSSVQGSVSDLEDEYSSLSTQVGTNTSDISSLSSTVQTMSSSVTSLSTTVSQNSSSISNLSQNKVDKENGKGLSSNDYTTAEKQKLAGIEENANNFVLPENIAYKADIPATLSAFIQDSTHRTITDGDRNIWNAKADYSDIPTSLSALSDDSTHRTVTDAEKSTWNTKLNQTDADKLYSHNDLTRHSVLENGTDLNDVFYATPDHTTYYLDTYKSTTTGNASTITNKPDDTADVDSFILKIERLRVSTSTYNRYIQIYKDRFGEWRRTGNYYYVNSGTHVADTIEWEDWNKTATTSEIPTKTSDIQNDAIPNKNYILNSNFEINSKGQTSYTGAGETVDKWNVLSSYVTVSHLNKTGISFTSTNASTGIVQFIDLDTTQSLIGQTVTISLKSKSTGNHVVALRYGGLTGSSTLIASKSIASSNDYSIQSFTATIPSIPTGNYIRLIIDTSSASGVVDIEWVKMEIGSTATTYEQPLYPEEQWKVKDASTMATVHQVINKNYIINSNFCLGLEKWNISNGTATQNEDGSVSVTAGTSETYFVQRLDHANFWGKTVTMSAELGSGTIRTLTGKLPDSAPSTGYSLMMTNDFVENVRLRLYYYIATNELGFTFDVPANETAIIKNAHFGISSCATPYEPPLYAEEQWKVKDASTMATTSDLANYVTLTTNQDITGSKVFTQSIKQRSSTNAANIDLFPNGENYNATPSEAKFSQVLQRDTNGNYIGGLRVYHQPNGTIQSQLMTRSEGTSIQNNVTFESLPNASSSTESGKFKFRPNTNGSIDLGSLNAKWNNFYLAGESYKSNPTYAYSDTPASNSWGGYRYSDKNNSTYASVASGIATNFNALELWVKNKLGNDKNVRFVGDGTTSANEVWSFRPGSTNDVNLGSTGAKWKDLYLAGDLNIGETNAVDKSINFVNGNTVRSKIRGESGGRLVYNAVGHYFRPQNNSLGIAITGENLRPEEDGTKDLGSSSYRWKNLYMSGDITDGKNYKTFTKIYRSIAEVSSSLTTSSTIADLFSAMANNSYLTSYVGGTNSYNNLIPSGAIDKFGFFSARKIDSYRAEFTYTIEKTISGVNTNQIFVMYYNPGQTCEWIELASKSDIPTFTLNGTTLTINL